MSISDDSGALDYELARRQAGAEPIRLPPLRFIGAAVVAVALAVSIYLVGRHGDPAPQLQLSLILGAAFGFVLQRARFCFFCIWKDWLDRRDPRGLLGILTALAVGLAGYTLIYGAWLPDPTGTRLPPTAHIGPVGPALLLAGLAFGAGMAISGSCISAHLYRLGEGSPTSPFALVGAGLGFILGFLSWNELYLLTISDSPVLGCRASSAMAGHCWRGSPCSEGWRGGCCGPAGRAGRVHRRTRQRTQSLRLSCGVGLPGWGDSLSA